MEEYYYKRHWLNVTFGQTSEVEEHLGGLELSPTLHHYQIVEELHKFREAHAAQFNYDVRALVESLREEGENSGRTVVSFAKETKVEATQ